MQEKFDNPKKKQAGAVSMIRRDGNKHALVGALIDLQFEELDNYTITKGSAVTAQNGDLIHTGQMAKYLNEDGNVSICGPLIRQ